MAGFGEAVAAIKVGAPLAYIGASGSVSLSPSGDMYGGVFGVWRFKSGVPVEESEVTYR
jgi:hypothetical protein